MQPVAASGEQSRVFPLTPAWTTSNLHAGQFTAACGVKIYRGDALGDAYRGTAFVCEPTGSLVHREVLSPHGATFTSRPATEGREFLASDDPWFRPVNLEVGPDGALYVVDMYRAVIEHPQFMPTELQQRPDLRQGDDRGRIYRITRADHPAQVQPPRLSAATTAELAAHLAHPNDWWRTTAARLLYERQDAAAQAPLEAVASRASAPAARAAALWALDSLGLLSGNAIAAALGDGHPGVREQAVALSEKLLDADQVVRRRVVDLAADPDPRVQFRVALAIGGLSEPQVVAPLAQMALAHADDPWMRRAVATALPQHLAPLLQAVLCADPISKAKIDSPEVLLVGELAGIVGARREPAEIAGLVDEICNAAPTSAAHEAALLGLAGGITRRGEGLLTFVAGLPGGSELVNRLTGLLDKAAEAALDEQLSVAARGVKFELLAHARSDRATKVCLHVVSNDAAQELRIAAAAALAAQDDALIAPALLADYPAQTPAVRRAILDTLSVRPAAAQQLLEAIEAGQIARAELGASAENRLKQHRDPAVRDRAERTLASAVPAERQAVLAEYQAALKLAPQPLAGKQLFRQHCATCHHIGDVGVDVAPDISDSRTKTPQQLLTDILNPNQAIDNNYVSYTVATADGNVHSGIVAAETAGSITLRQPENKTLTLLRSDIEAIRSSGVSLMPEGFEKHLSHQQMADLIGFVKNWRYLEQPVPGTMPPSTNP